MAIPFTYLRKPTFTEMPLAVIRYFLIFPVLVLTVIHHEAWIEAGISHLLAIALMIGLAHLALRLKYKRQVQEMRMGSDFEDEDVLFQRLGLGD